MNDQERLSNDYNDLKEKHLRLKATCVVQGIKNRNLDEANNKLLQRIRGLETELESLKQQLESTREKLAQVQDERVIVLPKNSNTGQYVGLGRFNKFKKMAEDYAIKYGDQVRSNAVLREKNIQLREKLQHEIQNKKESQI